MNSDSPFFWIIIAVIISVFAISILIFFIRRDELKKKPDYKTLFIIGITWFPIGISTNMPVFLGIGALFMIVGLANKKHWKADPKWTDMPRAKRKIKISISIGLALLLGGGIAFYTFSDQTNINISIHDELEPIFTDHRVVSSDSLLFTEVPKGSFASAHILVSSSSDIQDLRLKVSGLPQRLLKTINLYQLLDVHVPENTGLDSRTEKFSGQKNPFVIRRAPFNTYEVLKPIHNKIDSVIRGKRTAIRVEIPITEDFPVGISEIGITVGKFLNTKKVTLSANIYEIQLPELGQSEAKYVNWHSDKNIAEDHGVEIWSSEFWEILNKYAALMAKGRQNTFWFHWASFFEFTAEGQIQKFHRDRFHTYIQTFLNNGLSTIQGAPFTRRIDWGTDGILVSLPESVNSQVVANSASGEKLYMQMFETIRAEMQAKGWESIWYQGIFDEPTDQYTERYTRIADLLHTSMPDLKILEATMTTSLSGYVDAWCPQVHEFQKNQEFFKQEALQDNEIWVYTCLVPGGPWINRLVDQERLRSVYVGWALSHYNLDGFLHWGLNHHRGKPFKELVVQHGDEKNFLPAGDSHIIYPGPDAPWSSQRFEAHRIGMEDYELLEMLKKKDPLKAKEITTTLFRAFDDYEKDISKYREAKKELLENLSL